MPEKLRFEPQDTLSAQDFSIRKNKEMNNAQANETFTVDARFNRALGQNGETMAFAKKRFAPDPAVQEQREQARRETERAVEVLLNTPKVAQWVDDMEKMKRVEQSLAGAEEQLGVFRANLEKVTADLAALGEGAPAADLKKAQQAVERATANAAKQERFVAMIADPAAAERRLQVMAREDPAIKGYLEALAKHKEAVGLAESQSSVVLSSATLYEPGARMNDLSRGGDRQLLARAVASYAADRALGMNVCAEEKFGLDADGALIGISIQCDGAGVKSKHGTNEYGQSQTGFLDAKYNEPGIQKGLFDLETLDYITGQTDRHMGNVFVHPKSGKVTGIDNDLAFPEVSRAEMLEAGGAMAQCKAVLGLPSMMHQDTADKLARMDPEVLRAALKAVQPPDGSPGLNDRQIQGAVDRLQELKTAIANVRNGGKDLEIVAAFDDNTYQRAVEAQKKLGLGGSSRIASYVGAVESSREDVALDRLKKYQPSEYTIRPPGKAQQAQINPQYAAYLQMDSAKQAEYRAAQARLDALEKKLEGVQKDIAKMEHPSIKDRLTSLKHGGLDGTRQFLLAEDSRLSKELTQCMAEIRAMDGTEEVNEAVAQEAVQAQAMQAPAVEAPAAARERPAWVPAAPRPVDQDNLARGPDVPKPQKTRIQAKDKSLGLEGAAAPRRASVGDVLHREHAGAAAVAHGQAQTQPAPATAVAAPAAAPAPAAGQPKPAPGTLRAATQWQRAKPAGPGAARPGHGTHQ